MSNLKYYIVKTGKVTNSLRFDCLLNLDYVLFSFLLLKFDITININIYLFMHIFILFTKGGLPSVLLYP